MQADQTWAVTGHVPLGEQVRMLGVGSGLNKPTHWHTMLSSGECRKKLLF